MTMGKIGRGVLLALFAGTWLLPGEAKSLKVLMVGNSYTTSASRQMPEIAKAMGCELDLFNLAIGGATMEQHCKNIAKADDPSYAPYFTRVSWTSCPFGESSVSKVMNRDRANLPQVLAAEKWDIVTIQQASPLSAFYGKWQPHADNLIAKIRELAPQAEIRLQETWSWSPYNVYQREWKMTPSSMYAKIHEAYGILARKHGLKVIPTGAAVDIYRRELPVRYGAIPSEEELKALRQPELPDFFDDVVGAAVWKKDEKKSAEAGKDILRLSVDNIHLNKVGEYLQGCVWVAALFGVDVTKCTYHPEGLSEKKAAFLRKCAMAAFSQKEYLSFDRYRIDERSVSKVKKGFFLADAAKPDDEVEPIAVGGTAKGVKLTVDKRTEGEGLKKNAHFRVRLEGCEKRDRALTLAYSVRLPEGRTFYEKGPRSRTETTAGLQTLGGGVNGRYDVGAGGLNRWPFGAVTVDGVGYALAIDLANPAYFRTVFDPKTRFLSICFDLGLAPEKNVAEFGFRFFLYEQDFRGAIARHVELEPWAYENRLKRHGLWLDFTPMMDIKGWEDFGFMFMESPHGDRDWYDRNNIYTFCYNEPSTWWMKIKPKDGADKVTMEDCLAKANELVAKGDRNALVWKNSAMLDEAGKPAGKILNKNWCNGIAWSCSPLPGWEEPCDYWNKNPKGVLESRYAKPFPEGTDGEYLDSIEASYTVDMDFNRKAFKLCETPLCFSGKSRRPGIFKGLAIYEYARHVAKRVWPLGRTTMGNYTPEYWPWLSAYIDVCGKETAWIENGKYVPQCHRDMIELRARSMGKPYCFLMGVNYHEFDHECVRKYILRCIAYGMYPGVSWGYFTKPEKFYERDRDLFRKYMTLCKKVGEAGWRPRCTLVELDDENVYAEQFGDRIVTICNSTAKPRTVKFSAKSGSVAVELVKGGEVRFPNGECELELGPDDVLVLEFGGSDAKMPNAVRTPFTPWKPTGDVKAASAAGYDVVFLGDDLVANWKKAGAAVWEKEFAKGANRAAHFGFAGDCTEHLLWRLENGLLADAKPKVFVVMIGGGNLRKRNRIDEPPTDTILGVQAIVEWLKKNHPQAKVILNAVLAGTEGPRSPARVRCARVNQYFKHLAEDKKGRGAVCDFNDLLLTDMCTLNPTLSAGSGRLTESGYDVWATALKPYLDWALGRAEKVPQTADSKMAMVAVRRDTCLAAKPALARYWLDPSHNRFRQKRLEQYENRDRKYDAVWLGDSVSHYWEYPKFQDVFKEYFGNYAVFNNCYGGDEVQNTLWNLELGGALDRLEAKVVQLLIGENNVWWTTPTQLRIAVGECIRLIREKQPKAKILLLSMLPREVAHKRGGKDFRRPNKNADQIMDIIVKSNEELRQLAAAEKIEYVDMLPHFMDKEGLPDITLLPDGTHPNEAGYHVWGKLVRPVYERMLGR